MDIPVRGLTDGLRRHTQRVAVDELNLPEEAQYFSRSIQVDVTLEKVGHQVIVRGTVSASATMACSRCLEPVQIAISEPFTLLVRFDTGGLSGSPSEGEEDEDVKYLPPDADRIDITEELRQILLLALPVKPLCDQNCQGLCPQCGTNLNTGQCQCRPRRNDLRWAGLEKALKSSQGENRGRTKKKDL